MDWNSDPRSQWVAVYRITVLLLLLLQSVIVLRGHQRIGQQVEGVATTVAVGPSAP